MSARLRDVVMGGLVLAILASTSITSGQAPDALARARALYDEAAYDEALAAVACEASPEAFQYRALCHLALGRPHEAGAALEALVRLAPAYTLAEAEWPPKFVTLYAETRRRVMPGIARELFASARADVQAKETARARAGFEHLLALLQDPAAAAMPEAADLQLLVTSYLDILPAPFPSAAPARARSTPAVKPLPSAFSAAPAVASSLEQGAARTSAGAAAAAPGAPRRTLVPAVTVRQEVPAYPGTPPAPLSGAVRVTIGVDGRVTQARIEIPLEPRYDRRLLQAARTWRYQPATLDGTPLESEKVIEVRIDR